MSGDLVKNLKRAGEQVLGAKPLTGNDHVRLSALLKVAALEIEALCAARDDAAELRAALRRCSNLIQDFLDFGIAPVDRGPARHAVEAARSALAATEGES